MNFSAVKLCWKVFFFVKSVEKSQCKCRKNVQQQFLPSSLFFKKKFCAIADGGAAVPVLRREAEPVRADAQNRQVRVPAHPLEHLLPAGESRQLLSTNY